MKHLILSLSVAAALAGCAGGSGVAIPDTVAPLPVLREVNPNDVVGPATEGFFSPRVLDPATTIGEGRLEFKRLRYINPQNGRPTEDNFFIYTTPDGKRYPFMAYGFTTPFTPRDNFSIDSMIKTSHELQPTDNGGKILACCDLLSSSQREKFNPGDISRMRYGVWIDHAGTANLFVGGVLAKPEELQGATSEQPATGKATYEVWGMRVRNGHVVTTTHSTTNRSERSLLTVNFNTGKVGGTLKGNADFGSDIHFGDVNLHGNTFNGSVSSAGVTGHVSGGLYGEGDGWDAGGFEIGGKAMFDNNHNLDSVFGGKRTQSDEDSSLTDLTPLQ